jgi:superfamily II DNA or RNA helicase
MSGRKSESTIREQFDTATKRLGTEASSLLPPGHNWSDFSASSASELREQHPLRWQAYVNLLREQRGAAACTGQSLKNVQIVERLRAFIEKEAASASPTLRDAQVHALRDVLAHLEAGHLRGYIKCPTGFGKTVIFSQLVSAIAEPATVVVPKRLIARQTEEKFETFAPGIEVQQMHGGIKGESSQCNVTTYQYLQRAAFDGRYDVGGSSLYILDEGHKGLGKGFRRVLDAIPKDAIVLVFSATPKYNEEHSVEQHIGPCFHELSVSEAIRIGALAPVVTMVAKANID